MELRKEQKTELLAVARELLELVLVHEKKRILSGLCMLLERCDLATVRTGFCPSTAMHEFAVAKGLNVHGVWWFEISREQWYAPRIEFLNDWIKELENELNVENHG